MFTDQSLDFLRLNLENISPQELTQEGFFSHETDGSGYSFFFGLSEKFIHYVHSFPNQICVYEQNLQKIKAVQEILDEKKFEEISWIFSAQHMENLALKCAFKSGSFFYTKQYESIYQQFLLLIENSKILIARHHQAIKNHKINLERFFKSHYVLKQKNVELPNASIIGAGPSLKSAISEIKSLQSSSFIFSSLRAAIFLFENGIIPDFIGVLDSTEKLAIPLELRSVPCFFTYQSNPEQISDFSHPILMCNIDADPWQQFIVQQFLHPFKEIEAGHTVSSFLFSIALSFSAQKIILYGVDLAYENGKKYFTTTKCSLEGLKEVEGLEGKKYLTKQDFILSKYWFEYQRKKHPHVVCINRSRGLVLDGFETTYSNPFFQKNVIQLEKIEIINRKHIHLMKEKLQELMSQDLIEILFFSDLQDLALLEPLKKLFYIFLSSDLFKKEDEIPFYVYLIKELLNELKIFMPPSFDNPNQFIAQENPIEKFFLLGGQLHGEYQRFYQGKNLLNHGYYFLGKLQGKFISYFQTGKVSNQSFYCYGKKEGVFQSFYEDGTLYKSCCYVNGKKEGLVITYYPNQVLKSKIFYKDDKMEGVGILFNHDGSEKRKFIAENGLIISDYERN